MKTNRPFFELKENRPFFELKDSGLLWLINTSVLHPRGFALALNMNDSGEADGWQLLGDGSEPWRFSEDVPVDGLFAAVEATFSAAFRAAAER